MPLTLSAALTMSALLAAPRAVLADSLGLAAEAPIMAAELTDLGARDSGILDLTGLEHATGPTPSLSASRDTVQAPTEPVDSLAAKERPPSWWDLENNEGLRLSAKVAAGTWSCIVFTGMAVGVHASTMENISAHEGIGVFLNSSAIGCSVGFPLGVTSVDRYDSLPATLLAGVIPAAVGIGSVAFDRQIVRDWLGTPLFLIYVAPVLGSLIVSEVWRNPPEDRGASFGFAPTLNGGFSAAITLRY